MRTEYFILKVTGKCNLGCNYCFAREHFTGETMSLVMIKEIFEQIDSLGHEKVTVSWHGGEPLLLGKETFRKGIEYQKGLKTKFQNLVQTNGLLVDDEWVKLFKEYHVGVGVSLDGYKEVHDYNRPLPNGKGSFNLVMRGLTMLINAKVSNGIISVISKPTEAKKYFDFVKYLGIPGFHTKACNSSWQGATTLGDYTEFSKEIFDLWVQNDDPALSCRIFAGFAENLLGGQAKLCHQSGRCSHFISINTNGDVYPCDELMMSENNMGNILETKLVDILNSVQKQRFCSDLNSLHSECKKTCHDYDVCRGGCTSERLFYGDAEYCKHRKAVASRVRKWVSVNEKEVNHG